MAKFNEVGLEEVAQAFLRREKAAVEAVPQMVKAGAEIVRDRQRQVADRMFRGKRATGDLAGSIKATPVRGNDTGKYSEVYPHGTNRRGERNATVGFVQQYGRRNMDARPYMSTANAECADEVRDTQLRIFREAQK